MHPKSHKSHKSIIYNNRLFLILIIILYPEAGCDRIYHIATPTPIPEEFVEVVTALVSTTDNEV